jgi:DNA polymerase I
MSVGPRLPYTRVIACDFEYRAEPGDRPDVHCMVAQDLISGQVWRLWRNEMGVLPPFPTDASALFCAYYNGAEFNAFRTLGWPLPERSIDLCAEFKALTNGVAMPNGRGLLGALLYFGLPHMDAIEKKAMQDLAMRGGPYTELEKRALVDYCAQDVAAVARLFEPLVTGVLAQGRDLNRTWAQMLVRGAYMAALSGVEHRGIPLDAPLLDRLRSNWPAILTELIRRTDTLYGVFEDGSFRYHLFERYLATRGQSWPRTRSGRLQLDDDVLRDIANADPAFAPLRQLLATLRRVRTLDIVVGSDHRNRTMLSAFGSKTARNTPGSTHYAFGPATWVRSLIKPRPGRVLLYADWSAQEPGIAGYLSGDQALIDTYASGDVYWGSSRRAGLVACDRDKRIPEHEALRNRIKVLFLAIGYGMGVRTLARQLERPEYEARDLMRRFEVTFPVFCNWSQQVGWCAGWHGRIRNQLGWPLLVDDDTRPTTVRNFPMQSTGSAMLQIALVLAEKHGLETVAVVHDALMIESDVDEAADVEAAVRAVMVQASRELLGGLELRVDVATVRHPDRYQDPRGEETWNEILRILAATEGEDDFVHLPGRTRPGGWPTLAG